MTLPVSCLSNCLRSIPPGEGNQRQGTKSSPANGKDRHKVPVGLTVAATTFLCSARAVFE